MRLQLLSALLLCLVPGCSTSKSVPSNLDQWVEHQDQNLKVKLPFKPQLKTQNVSLPGIGSVNFKMYLCEISRRSGFMVSQFKYPIDPRRYDVSGGLKGAVSQMAKSTNSTIQSEKSIEHNSLPGKEVVMKSPNGFLMKARLFIDGKGPTLYQFQAIGNQAFVDGKAVGQFFESVSLSPIQGSTPSPNKGKGSFE